uniref:Uncharacterized protein n=1 Tax=Chenopodium quinoa TaxID=63459 RepID=A0A803LNM5_CHEQI
MDALREKGARMKPLLCAYLTQEEDKVSNVGVTGMHRIGAVHGNAFVMAFKNAAREIGAELVNLYLAWLSRMQPNFEKCNCTV